MRTTTTWSHEDATRPTEPCPASVDHDGAEAWIDQFLATARDQDTWLAVVLAADFAGEVGT